jgi:hypothetical protein
VVEEEEGKEEEEEEEEEEEDEEEEEEGRSSRRDIEGGVELPFVSIRTTTTRNTEAGKREGGREGRKSGKSKSHSCRPPSLSCFEFSRSLPTSRREGEDGRAAEKQGG